MDKLVSMLRGAAAPVFAAGLLAAGPAHAQADIVGAWWSSVERYDCASGATLGSFSGMQVFHRGGTMSDTSSQDPATRGPGLGTWRRVGSNVVARFRILNFSAGAWSSTAVVTRTITLAPDGATATANSTIEVYNPAGVMFAAGCARDSSVRLD